MTKKKVRIGRPPIPKKLQKSSVISVRFSAEERRTLDKMAKRTGKRLSEWAREVLLSAASSES